MDVRILPLPPALARLGESGAGERCVGPARRRAHGGGRIARRVSARAGRRSLTDRRRRDCAHQRLQAAHSRDLVGAGGRAARLAHARICRPASDHPHAPEAPRFPGRGDRRELAQRGRGSVRACSDPTPRSRRSTTPSISSEFSPDGAARRSRSACGPAAREPDVVRVGLVATFGRWKGHETFLRAMQRVTRASEASAATSSARRSTTRPAASTRWTRSGALARECRPRGSRRLHRIRRAPGRRRCARSTSSSTRARSRSRSVWSSPKAWRAAGPSSSAAPAAQWSSSTTA